MPSFILPFHHCYYPCYKSMLSTNIYPVCWESHYLSLCLRTEGLPCPSAQRQRQSPLISGVAQSCSSLTTHEMFSHVHIRLILNVQQHCFFVCCKMAHECSQILETVLWCWGPWSMTTKLQKWLTYQQINRTQCEGLKDLQDPWTKGTASGPIDLQDGEDRHKSHQWISRKTRGLPDLQDHWWANVLLDLQDHWWASGQPVG